jgi:putative flippase GtrA
MTRGERGNRRVRAELSQLLRFCAVGGLGFAVDAGVLLAAIHISHLDPISGRLLSFSLAVWATFMLNRYWTFRNAQHRGYLAAFAAYLAVQGIGFLCNLGIYASLYLLLPAPLNRPLFCLIVASAVALTVNYGGARWAVFPSR